MPVLRSLVSFVPVAGIALLTAAVHAEDADLAAINRIRTEAFQRSRVMDFLHINVIAELPGKAPGGEFVMLGAHLDSWHGATGATDNGAGSAVVMEVMRILASLDRPLARGVRAALWSGEEQCLCGSRAYVKQHFADPVTMQLKPEHARLSAYFNLDNGAGRIRGVYLQGNDMARPIFEAWSRRSPSSA